MLSSTQIQDLLVEAESALLDALASVQGPGVVYSKSDARTETMRLIQHITGVSATQQRAFPEKHLSDAQVMQLNHMLLRRMHGEPVAYIVGEQGFYDSIFAVAPCTLIPRPETEMLVDLALQKITDISSPQILDLGTGTGAIGLSIAKAAPHSEVVCVDFVPDAVNLAKHNQQALKIANADIFTSDWFNEIHQTFHVICSNPPYVEPGSPYLQKGDIRFEPQSALTSELNGLADIKLIIQSAPQYLHFGGWLMLEDGFEQGSAIQALFSHAGFTDIQTLCDYAQQPRITLGRMPSSKRSTQL